MEISTINKFHAKEEKCLKTLIVNWILAWSLLCDCCAKLIEYIKDIILSDHFITQHKQKPSDFTRQRKLPFQILIFFMMNLISGSYQKELNNFFQRLMGLDVPKRFVSKVALSKARLKLKYEAFVELNRHLVQYFYRHFESVSKWHGFNLLVVDGSLIRLPRIKKIAEHFGAWHPVRGQECPMARASLLFDPLNRISIDAIISPKHIGERELAAQHFLNLLSEDLVLLDRGYPAYWLFNLILSLQANFCARISNKKWKIVRKFFNCGRPEKIISLPAYSTSIKMCRQMGLDLKPLKLRLIRIDLPTGETEILITSLIDDELYPYDIFAELYHQRWFVEEDYKKIKCWIEVENFTGKTVLSIYQDFHARVFSKNMTQILSLPTKPFIEQADRNRKYSYQVNFAQALASVKNTIVLLFNRSMETVNRLLHDLLQLLSMTVEPVRPGRSYPRNHKKRKNFYLNYKPIG
jgi:hypothetical protein